MDRYKHNASIQRRIKCAPNPTQTENSGDSAGIQSINGTGEIFKSKHHSAPNSHCKVCISCKHALAAFCFPGDHQNNNKSFSNGTCLPVCFPSPGVNPHISLTYDYRQDAFFKCLITRRRGGGVVTQVDKILTRTGKAVTLF